MSDAAEYEKDERDPCDHGYTDVVLTIPAEVHGPDQQWLALHREIGTSEITADDGRPVHVAINDLFDGSHMIDLHDERDERIGTVRINLRPMWTEAVLHGLQVFGRVGEPAPVPVETEADRPWTDADEALQAVKDLHRSRKSNIYRNGRCATCYTVTGGSVPWPCKTLRAMGVES